MILSGFSRIENIVLHTLIFEIETDNLRKRIIQIHDKILYNFVKSDYFIKIFHYKKFNCSLNKSLLATYEFNCLLHHSLKEQSYYFQHRISSSETRVCSTREAHGRTDENNTKTIFTKITKQSFLC